MIMKNGLIIGKGWLGNRLENELKDKYLLTTTKRVSDAENCLSIDFDQPIEAVLDISLFDFIIIMIPFGKRDTIEILNKRFNYLINWIKSYNKQIFLISSTGIYPDLDAEIDENTFKNFQLLEPYITIEKLMQNEFPQINILRLGGLMGDDRYLSKYLNQNSEKINQFVNHIHYQDVIEIINQLIQKNITSEIYNITTLLHPTKQEVINYQLSLKPYGLQNGIGKKISAKKIANELNYQFIHPNPIIFK